MRCEVARVELSARLDDGDDRRLRAAVNEHAEGCVRCRAFLEGAWRLRGSVRLEPASPVPDLVPAIMERVARERGAVVVRRRWRREATAFAAAAVIAALVVGGVPALRVGPPPVVASEIPRRVAAASIQIEEYRAVFDVVERNFAPEVPLRRFRASVTFRAPEQLRSVVRDLTRYPSERWPRNDVVLAVDAGRWSLGGPSLCPREALPACGSSERVVSAVRGREPFDADAPLPSDIVVPVKTLAGSGRVRVLGEGRLAGRRVVRVELDQRDAAPLLSSLQAGGSWRPLFPGDRVEVSLDRRTWFPLSYRVLVADAPERDAWALRNGLPPERPGLAILEARARSFGDAVPHGWSPRPAGAPFTRDRGFRSVDWRRLRAVAGFEPAVPSTLEGLRRHRAGVFARGREAGVLTSYARGLSWLEVRETRSRRGRSLFGDVGLGAERVRLPDGGVAYHEPPTTTLGRRLAIHAGDRDIYIESNLPLGRMMRVAAGLGVRGEEIPEAWLVRRVAGSTVRHGVDLRDATRDAPFLLLPGWLPAEYRLWSVNVSGGRAHAATVYFRRTGGESSGRGIRLHQARGQELAPPADPGVLAVRVRGVVGRYSPLREELEWVEGGIYRSVRGEGLGLARIAAVAGSLRPPDVRETG